MSKSQPERRGVQETAPADVEDVAAPASGWAALADTASSGIMAEVVVADTPPVVTTAEPAAGWAILAEGRARSEAAEVEVAVETEALAEASPSGWWR